MLAGTRHQYAASKPLTHATCILVGKDSGSRAFCSPGAQNWQNPMCCWLPGEMCGCTAAGLWVSPCRYCLAKSPPRPMQYVQIAPQSDLPPTGQKPALSPPTAHASKEFCQSFQTTPSNRLLPAAINCAGKQPTFSIGGRIRLCF